MDLGREWHCPTDAVSVLNVRPLRDRIDGHHGEGIRGVRVAECLRAVTNKTALSGGKSEWSEHANLRDTFTMDSETIVDGVGEQCDVLPEAGQETMSTVNYPA